MSTIKIVTLQNEILQTHTMEKMQTKDNTKALQKQIQKKQSAKDQKMQHIDIQNRGERSGIYLTQI